MTGSVTALHLGTTRPALLRVDETTDEAGCTVTVTLAFEGNLHVGTASGDASASVRAALVATAALDSVSPASRTYTVTATNVTEVGPRSVAIVLVDSPNEQHPLVGSALIRTENHQIAFARAALDAVNRRLNRPR